MSIGVSPVGDLHRPFRAIGYVCSGHAHTVENVCDARRSTARPKGATVYM